MYKYKNWLIKRFKIEKTKFDKSGIYAYTECLFAYHSNKIEGGKMTLEQTISQFTTGLLPKSDDYYRSKDVEEMSALLDWYANVEKNIETLALFHARFESIHPFQDGNGRTGRMILFRESLKYDELKPFIILDKDRTSYIEGLTQYRKEQKVDQLIALIE